MDKYEEVLSKYNTELNDADIASKVKKLMDEKLQENNTPAVYKKLYGFIDLTSLNTTDNKEEIWKFVQQVNDFDSSNPEVNNVAAICVFPNFVSVVKEALTANVNVAAVSGGFPSSQTFLEVKIAETALAVAEGADEIDIVLNVGNFFANDYEAVSVEIEEIKHSCRDAALKVILETGALKTASSIKKATILSMYSGADFIKTSTGKVYPGASLEAAFVICEALKQYYALHNKKIGFKVSGGVRTPEEAAQYYTIVKEVLGEEWLKPEYFRIGASSLADSLKKSF